MKPGLRRPGYSLLEVILVIALIAMAAAILVPSIKGMYPYYKQQAGVDTVRAAWAQARARAIEESRPYRFSVEKDGSHFRIAPDHHDFWNGGKGEGGYVREEALPAGVRFNVGGDSASQPPTDDSETERPASGDWTTTAVFLPDGTAEQDVAITFQIAGARPITLRLRGLTGNVSVQTH